MASDWADEKAAYIAKQQGYADDADLMEAIAAALRIPGDCVRLPDGRVVKVPDPLTSGETMAVRWPIDVMDGAEWNILDSCGTRIACCGYDSNDPHGNGIDTFGSGRKIGVAIVAMIRNLSISNEVLREEVARLNRAAEAARGEGST